jgi:hypothetical protein
MRMPTYNKLGYVKCLACKTADVPMEKWNIPCADCLQKRKVIRKDEKANVHIGRRLPFAAVKLDESGKMIFVDKYGKEVHDHGYDLEHDPRGYQKTGTAPKKIEVI